MNSATPYAQPRNCIVYLCRGKAEDVNNLYRSLELVHAHVRLAPTTDIIIFHEPDFSPYIPGLSAAYKLRFVELEFKVPSYPDHILQRIPEYFPHPYAGVKGHSAEFSPGFDMGYRHMCRWFAGEIFKHPVMQEYDYYMRLDCDSFILSPMDYDLFEWAKKAGCYYGYIASAVQLDHADVVKGLWETAGKWRRTDYGKFCGIGERMMYYTNFEICKIHWFWLSAYGQFWDHLDSTGGCFWGRWGDAPIRYLGVNLFMDPKNIIPVQGIHYQHGAIYKT